MKTLNLTKLLFSRGTLLSIIVTILVLNPQLTRANTLKSAKISLETREPNILKSLILSSLIKGESNDRSLKLSNSEKEAALIESLLPGLLINSLLKNIKLIKGAKAPEIVSNNPEGKEIPLSALKGKYVLIDFWASWCGPCRDKNKHLSKIYNEYNKKGFEIYSISLDQRQSSWQKAIKKDSLIWDSHVSDLSGWGSIAAQEYQITGLPSTFLIDKEGLIIAKDPSSKELDKILKRILK